MSFSASKRPVLITGCSSGIGYCAASGLRERGYRVIATARQDTDVARLRADGFEALLLDLRDSDSIHRAFQAALELTGGQLYALFNNGGYGQAGAVEDLSREALREQFETNVFGWQELSNLAIPIMRGQGQGRIVQNSSVLGFVAMAYRGAYNASKYAIEALSDTLRLELRGSGVYVVLIEPGPITSRFRSNALAALRRHVDIQASVHAEYYAKVLERLRKPGPAAPFTLPPEAVVRALLRALEAPKPRLRYRVTVPTHLFAVLKRLLPARALDPLLWRASG
jgi:NAD(P)-dependent dehydrogenase (short-subunit alcohol dehydrogenase family)